MARLASPFWITQVGYRPPPDGTLTYPHTLPAVQALARNLPLDARRFREMLAGDEVEIDPPRPS
jgi:hypothetical protein